MTEFVNDGDLASYLAGDRDLILALANELVHDVTGDLNPVPPRVKTITLEVAARATRNPDGITSVTTSIDDWSKTKRYEAAAQAGIYLTDDERAELAGARPDAAIRQRRSIQLGVPGYVR